jgi:fermentation-respiration switch protein FrsA (DUF1100 family)
MSVNFRFVILTLLALALVGLAGLWAFQRFGVYRLDAAPQTPADVGLADAVEIVDFVSEDGQSGRAWVARAAGTSAEGGRPYILSFHGDASSIGGTMAVLAPLIEAGYGVVMMQYRGTQGLPGHPSETGFATDARALYDQLDTLLGETVPAEMRVLHGYSLGAGVGSRLAAARPFAGVILQSAPYRACLYYERRYRIVPFCRLMWRERYDIVDHLRGIEAPVLIVHGVRDEAVPAAEARANYEAAPNPWGLRLLEGGHADLAQHGLNEAIAEFVDAVTVPPPR